MLNNSKRSMMPEWHQLDSSSIMLQQQESTKKKTLKSSSRSFWFSTGLVCTLIKHSVTKFSVISLHFSKKYFPKVRIFMRIMILWYYQIRPKVVWEVHGAWIDGYFLSIILASLRLEHYARYDSENKDKPLPLQK